MVRFQNLQCKANVHHHAFLQAIQTVPCWQSHRHFGLNSQPLFGSCPGSMTHSREGPWERAEKRLGVQATFTLPSWKSGKRKYQLPLPALSAGERRWLCRQGTQTVFILHFLSTFSNRYCNHAECWFNLTGFIMWPLLNSQGMWLCMSNTFCCFGTLV